MTLLIDHINNGFLECSTKLPDSIKAYFSFRDELSVCNGSILKGQNKIVVPEILRPQAINILHNKAHLGLSKTLERACMCMYWPGITDAIRDSVSACKPCLTFSSKQQCELHISDTVTQPWSHLSLDNFRFQGYHYIMIMDITTKFFVVRSVSSLTTDCTIPEVEILFQIFSSSIANI